MIPPRLVLATGNPEKVAELAPLLARYGVTAEWRDLPSPPEDGATWEENAAIKALAAAAATGLPALGDDAGLCVDAWDGRPGLETRRWAEELGGWEAARSHLSTLAGSRASFWCGLALALPDGAVRTALGSTTGAIVRATRPGVGLEPCFQADGTDTSLPDLSPDLRDRIHYRNRALRRLFTQAGAAPG